MTVNKGSTTVDNRAQLKWLAENVKAWRENQVALEGRIDEMQELMLIREKGIAEDLETMMSLAKAIQGLNDAQIRSEKIQNSVAMQADHLAESLARMRQQQDQADKAFTDQGLRLAILEGNAEHLNRRVEGAYESMETWGGDIVALRGQRETDHERIRRSEATLTQALNALEQMERRLSELGAKTLLMRNDLDGHQHEVSHATTRANETQKDLISLGQAMGKAVADLAAAVAALQAGERASMGRLSRVEAQTGVHLINDTTTASLTCNGPNWSDEKARKAMIIKGLQTGRDEGVIMTYRHMENILETVFEPCK